MDLIKINIIKENNKEKIEINNEDFISVFNE